MPLRQMDPFLDSHGPVAKLTFEIVVPHKSKYSMVGLSLSICFGLFGNYPVFLTQKFIILFLLHIVGFRNKFVDDIEVVKDKKDWGLFIDSCFTHCQTPFDISWNSQASPVLGNKVRLKSLNCPKVQNRKSLNCTTVKE